LEFFEGVEQFFSHEQRIAVFLKGAGLEKIEIGTISFEGKPTIRDSYAEAIDFLKVTKASFDP
jgi:hypothetical protein